MNTINKKRKEVLSQRDSFEKSFVERDLSSFREAYGSDLFLIEKLIDILSVGIPTVEIADRLGISAKKLNKLIKKGKIQSSKNSDGKELIRFVDVLKYFNNELLDDLNEIDQSVEESTDEE